jgi:hypothetical protein
MWKIGWFSEGTLISPLVSYCHNIAEIVLEKTLYQWFPRYFDLNWTIGPVKNVIIENFWFYLLLENLYSKKIHFTWANDILQDIYHFESIKLVVIQ